MNKQEAESSAYRKKGSRDLSVRPQEKDTSFVEGNGKGWCANNRSY